MSLSPTTTFATPDGLARSAFPAMGTDISLLVPEQRAEDATQCVRDVFTLWEKTFSRFLPDSELSHVNALAGKPTNVSPLFFGVVSNALLAAEVTHGRFDPTLREQMQSVGYDRSFDNLPDTLPLARSIPRAGGGWRHIAIDRSRRRITLPEGCGLDFGGIAKGMAVDTALERLRERGIRTALINAGGDLAVMGLPPNSSPDMGSWPIATQGIATSWTVPLHHGAMATSGIGRRHWRQGDTARHHLIDPMTGESVRNDLWSVTVVAARCELAEVAAKAAFVAGVSEGAALLRAYGVAGLFIRRDGSTVPVGAWPMPCLEGD